VTSAANAPRPTHGESSSGLNDTGVATPDPALPGISLAVHSPQVPGSRNAMLPTTNTTASTIDSVAAVCRTSTPTAAASRPRPAT
jgi:hypothetical protein